MKKMRICVFCGSHAGNDRIFTDTTQAFARKLLEKKYGVVYGGGGCGLMNVLAETMLEGGGEVIGVTTQLLLNSEAKTTLTNLYITDTMHERKAKMYQLADEFVLLPGGIGSLDEFFEMYTWASLGLHQKPCTILNIHHYFDDLLKFLDTAEKNGFLTPEVRHFIRVSDSVDNISFSD